VPGYAKAADMAANALHNGLHTANGVGAWTKVLDPEQQEVAWTIINNRTNTAPASGWLGWEDKARTPADGVGSIPLVDCAAAFPFQLPADADWKVSYNASQAQKRQACATENLWRSALNTDWEKNGAVLIYEFLTVGMVPNNLSAASVLSLGYKNTNHKYYVDAVTGASKISRANLRTWLVNGCMSQSIIGENGQSLGPSTPLDYIEALRLQGETGIGFPPVVIPIALAVMALNYKAIKHLINVISGTESLKQAIKTQVGDLQSFIDRYASDVANLAGTDDWKLPDGQSADIPVIDEQESSGGSSSLGKNGLLVGGGLLVLALAMGSNKKGNR
jgi:hypothetical protein